jgi:quinol monooxygenase YgiN
LKIHVTEDAMKAHVSWVNELAIKDGALDTFKELMEEMVSGTRAEPGTLAYEWYISPDGSTVHVFEIYADSEAVVAHHISEGVHNEELGRTIHGVCRLDAVRRLRRPERRSPRDSRPARRQLSLRLGRFLALLARC